MTNTTRVEQTAGAGTRYFKNKSRQQCKRRHAQLTNNNNNNNNNINDYKLFASG